MATSHDLLRPTTVDDIPSGTTADRYWYCSPSADSAISEALAADGRRTWDPRHDSPSLATLEGKARSYAAAYRHSRARLLEEAGVVVHQWRQPRGGRRVWIVTMPGEDLSAAVAVDPDGWRLVRAPRRRADR